MSKIAQPARSSKEVVVTEKKAHSRTHQATNSSGSSRSIFQRLFTKDDRYNVHKILGYSALVSFAYRFANFGERDGNFGPHWQTLFFVAHHFSLNASSFIFHIPEQRIASGDRIWPQYRLHSLIFTSRSLLCMLVLWCEQVYDIAPTSYWKSINVLIVLGTCAAADYVSSKCKYQSNTIRGVHSKRSQYPDERQLIMSLIASSFQFPAAVACLVGTGRYTTQVVLILVIQVTAFFLTLRRKNVGSTELLVVVYVAMLLGGGIAILIDDIYANKAWVYASLGLVANSLRIDFHLNKYILWAAMGLLVHWLRLTGNLENNNFWNWAHVPLGLGFWAKLLRIAIAKKNKKSEI